MAIARRSSISLGRSRAGSCHWLPLSLRRRPFRPREFTLAPQGIKLLLEAMPAAIGLLAHGRLIHANSAFAYAFGYRSLSELIEAGGLEAILPHGMVALVSETEGDRSAPVDALTRSRRKLESRFCFEQLDPEAA